MLSSHLYMRAQVRPTSTRSRAVFDPVISFPLSYQICITTSCMIWTGHTGCWVFDTVCLTYGQPWRRAQCILLHLSVPRKCSSAHCHDLFITFCSTPMAHLKHRPISPSASLGMPWISACLHILLSSSASTSPPSNRKL